MFPHLSRFLWLWLIGLQIRARRQSSSDSVSDLYSSLFEHSSLSHLQASEQTRSSFRRLHCFEEQLPLQSHCLKSRTTSEEGGNSISTGIRWPDSSTFHPLLIGHIFKHWSLECVQMYAWRLALHRWWSNASIVGGSFSLVLSFWQIVHSADYLQKSLLYPCTSVKPISLLRCVIEFPRLSIPSKSSPYEVATSIHPSLPIPLKAEVESHPLNT